MAYHTAAVTFGKQERVTFIKTLNGLLVLMQCKMARTLESRHPVAVNRLRVLFHEFAYCRHGLCQVTLRINYHPHEISLLNQGGTALGQTVLPLVKKRSRCAEIGPCKQGTALVKQVRAAVRQPALSPCALC